MAAKKKRKAAKPYHHGNLEVALLKATLDMIREQGVEAVTLREVGARTGVSRTALYRHFASKADLLARVALQGFLGLQAVLNNARTHAQESLADPLEEMGVAYVKYAVANASNYRTMFGRAIGDWSQYPDLSEAGDTAFGILFDSVVQGQREGHVQPGDPLQIANVIWSLVHGLSMLLMDGLFEKVDSPEALARLAAATIRDGLKPAAKPASSRRGDSPSLGNRPR